MKLHSLLLTLMCATSAALWAQGPNQSGTYYEQANGKKGAQLKTALYEIIKEPGVVSYSGLKAAYVSTDTRADGYLRDWYSNATQYVPGSDFGSAIRQEGDGYNREHLMPQSWYNKVSPMVSDVVQVVPTDGYTNSRRNDLPFGEVVNDENRVKTSLNGYSKWGAPKAEIGAPDDVTTVFEPSDDIKGDIARIYFYMATCYEDRMLQWTGNNAQTVIGGDTHQPLRQWVMDLLMRWSQLDPVDDVERARNEAAYGIQRNRNPFVDFPGLENFIWGNRQDVAFSYSHYDADATEDMEGSDEATDDETPTGGTIMLNRDFFGVDWNGTRPSGGATRLTGKQNGVTVAYAKGESGQNMYCNDRQIRLYQNNELTFSVKGTTFTEIAFTTANRAKQLQANTGTVNDYAWTGNAESVTFSVESGTGNLQLTSALVTLAPTTAIVVPVQPLARHQAHGVYSLTGQQQQSTRLKPGIYIKDGRKVVVR